MHVHTQYMYMYMHACTHGANVYPCSVCMAIPSRSCCPHLTLCLFTLFSPGVILFLMIPFLGSGAPGAVVGNSAAHTTIFIYMYNVHVYMSYQGTLSTNIIYYHVYYTFLGSHNIMIMIAAEHTFAKRSTD